MIGIAHRVTGAGARRAPLDARLVVGVLLVIASVGGTTAVVAAADASVPVWAAATAIVPGQRIDGDDLVEVRVRTGGEAPYLRGDLADRSFVADRVVGAGELVPVSAVSIDGGRSTAAVVIPVSDALPEAVAAGALVDVWVVPLADGDVAAAPEVLVRDAVVARLDEAGGFVGAGTRSVEVVVAADDTAALLAATATGGRISLVPTGAVRP